MSEEVTDKVQISALLEAERAAGGSLEKGDLVGVYLSFDPFELDEAGSETTDDVTRRAAAVLADESSDARSRPPIELDRRSGRRTDEDPERQPARVPARAGHQRADHQCTGEPARTTDEDTGIAQVTGTQYVVTLALSPEQSERFVFATEFGHVWLSIEPATVDDDGTRPVTLSNVYTVVR